MAWVVVGTKVGEERRAAINCRRQGFVPYLPEYFDRNNSRRRLLFPRYLFVDLVGPRSRWGAIHSTRGVHHVITNNGQLCFVRHVEIDRIRQMENEHGVVELPGRPSFAELKSWREPKQFAFNEPVRITEGSFAGNIGLFQNQTVQQREKVLLDWLGSVFVPMEHLEAVK